MSLPAALLVRGGAQGTACPGVDIAKTGTTDPDSEIREGSSSLHIQPWVRAQITAPVAVTEIRDGSP